MSGIALWFLAPRWSDQDMARLHENAAIRLAAAGPHPSLEQRQRVVVAAMQRTVDEQIRRDLRWRHRRAAAATWACWAAGYVAGETNVAAAVAAGIAASTCRGRSRADLRAVLTDLAWRWTEVAALVPVGVPPLTRR